MSVHKSLLLFTSVLGGCSAAYTSPLTSAPVNPATENRAVVAEAGPAKANPANWPKAASPAAITDAKTESAIDALISKMTLEQKVGQVIQADIGSITADELAKYPIGSILAGGNSGPYGNERASGAVWLQLAQEFRAASAKAGAGIPILFGIDAVHGHSNIPGATLFPHNVGLGAARDPELLYRIGQVTASEIAASGIEWTFAPTLAVPQDVRWGRSYEGYSSDPKLIAEYSRAMTLGLQGDLTSGKTLSAEQVAATAKHFLADGGTKDGRDQGDAQISERELADIHGAGYPPAIEAGVLTVMASFSSWNGVKHHGNASLLTDVLKKRMGFAGLVVGDWNGHGQVKGCSNVHCPQALNAGLDLYMAPDSWRGLYDNMLQDAREGRLDLARLDDAVRRILRVKYKLGLMGDATVTRGNPPMLGAEAHLAVAREAVSKSLVLLKNEGGVLPIKPGASVLIAGPGADSMAMQSGGWTITWQGSDTTAADFPNGQTIGRAIADAVKTSGGHAHMSADGTFTKKPDVAIVVMGEKPYAEFQGDVPNIAFQGQEGEQELIASLKSKGIKVVTVFLSGRPMFTGPLINQSDAFVAAWLPGSQGAGVADVLVADKTGKPARDFTGTLSFPWPEDAQSPITKPLWPLGYGLSYAKPATVAPVNEDPRVEMDAVKPTTFFDKGVVPAPWYLAVDGMVTQRAVDISAQEDGRQFTWQGSGKFSIEGTPIDLGDSAQKSALMLEWRIDAKGNAPVILSFSGGKLDISSLIRSAKLGDLQQSYIPLKCFQQAGANLQAVGAPMHVQSGPNLSLSIRRVKIAEGHNEQACP